MNEIVSKSPLDLLITKNPHSSFYLLTNRLIQHDLRLSDCSVLFLFLSGNPKAPGYHYNTRELHGYQNKTSCGRGCW